MRRSLTAGFAAMLGVGLVLAPAATSARSGGFAGARAGVVRPALVRPGFVPPQPVVGKVAAPIHLHRLAPFRLRRDAGSPVAVWGDSGYAAGYDQSPLIYPAATDPAADGAPDQGRIVYVPPPPGCRSSTQMVPSEAGGERKITITRCWR